MKQKILVVDDDASHRKMIETVLTAEGYEIHQAENGESSIQKVESQFYDLILMDLRMHQLDGIQTMQHIRKISPGIPIVIMTAYSTVDTAVKALKTGACDYLTKPVEIEELKIVVDKALHHRRLEEENLRLKERLGERFDFSGIIGQSKTMTDLFETTSLVAPSDATVLITGESGTGKELIANAIHENSLRKGQPFVKVNCAALPENLLESELFGHRKGAFTGATDNKKGRFQAAHNGSLFLDEIAEMAPVTQAKILRVLQEQEFEPLGSTQTIKVDTRIISATNKILEDEVTAKQFREDLFYRLNVVKITVPPLRDRKEDIPLLAKFFLKKYTIKNKKLINTILPRAMDVLMRYAWPGNVRELENVIERCVIMARGDVITTAEFPDNLKKLSGDTSDMEKETDFIPGKSLKDVERSMIIRTLRETRSNRTHAAEILGISRRTLQLKIKEYGIDL